VSSDLEDPDTDGDAAPSSAAAGDAPSDVDVLRGQVELLEEENRRLRAEYTRARRSQYRRTGAAIGLVGLLAAVAGVLYPAAQTVLFALGGTGLFLGLLVFYLTPETVLSADIGERVYDALAGNEAAIAGELGLSDRRLVVPGVPGEPDTKLYVPREASADTPDPEVLTETVVVSADHRGLALRPSGHALYEEFEPANRDDLAEDPGAIADGVVEALVEQFELVRTVETDLSPDADGDTGRVTVGVGGSAFGDVDRFDHPVPSFVGVAVASELHTPVALETEPPVDDRLDALVSCRWGELDDIDPDTSGDTADLDAADDSDATDD
jgi:hypothetical protein